MKKLIITTLAVLPLCANAALHDRGNGLIYDDVLNITWLQDANYAKTSGYDDDGRMSWQDAKAWAAQLTIVDPVYGEMNGWRLPSARLDNPVEYSFPVNNSDVYKISRGELGHMHYNNLGNAPLYDAAGTLLPNNKPYNSTYTDTNGSIEIKSFISFPNHFWYSEEDPTRPSLALVFDTGYQASTLKGYPYLFAWAVCDGDVANGDCYSAPVVTPEEPVNEVPVPAAAWLFGSALAGLALRKRK